MNLNSFKTTAVALAFAASPLFAGFGTVTVSSSTHDANTPSNATSVSLSWAAPTTTNGTSLNGYYYKLDQSDSTLMTSSDTVLASSATSKSESITGSDGSYYFHIAPYATNGDIGATSHFGPIKIDTTAPSALSISPDGGSYSETQSVSMSATDANSYTIYYTTDDSTPTSSSDQYSSAITVATSKTVKAIAIDTAGNSSAVKTSSFTINTTTNVAQFGSEISDGGTVATSNSGGSSTLVREVSVEGSSVTHYKYKVDTGSYSAQTEIATAIDISTLTEGSHTLYIVGYDGSSWQAESSATSLTFTIDNTEPGAVSFSTASGSTLTSATTVTISSTDSNNIYYTLDGTTPDSSSTNSATVSLSSNGDVTLKAIAYDTAGNKSSVAQALYTINIPAPSSGSSSSSSNTTTNDTTTSEDDNTTISEDDNVTVPSEEDNTTVPSEDNNTTTTPDDSTDNTTTPSEDTNSTIDDSTDDITVPSEDDNSTIDDSTDDVTTPSEDDNSTTDDSTNNETSEDDPASVDTGYSFKETTSQENEDGSTTNSTSFTGTDGEEITIEVTTNVDNAATVTNGDGSISTTHSTTNSSGDSVNSEIKVNPNGTVTNTFTVGSEVIDINISIVGADTTIKSDGSIETLATRVNNNKTLKSKVAALIDGNITSNFTVEDSDTNSSTISEVISNIIGTDIEVDENASIKIVTPAITVASGNSVKITSVTSEEGDVSVETETFSLPIFKAGASVILFKDEENNKVLIKTSYPSMNANEEFTFNRTSK